jgi:hypothetical protein
VKIFAKNAGGGISTSYQTAANSGWAPQWTDLGQGPGIQDGLAAKLNPAGLIELFALNVVNGVPSILNMYQPRPNGGFNTAPSFATLAPAGPPTIAMNADGRFDIFYRLADGANGPRGGNVGHTWQTAVAGGYTTTPEDLGGNGCFGPVSVASAPTNITDARIILLQHDRTGGVTMNAQVAPNAGYGATWTGLGGFIANEPTLAADATGVMSAFAFDGQGKLLLARQTSAAGGAPFGAWTHQGT